MENSELICRAVRYIERTGEKTDISVEDVAEHAGFSPDYFNRVFAAHTGFNVMEYIRFIRMKKAVWLLRRTEENVLDIALACGYNSHESFTRAFKKQYGKTPSEYREENRGTEAVYGDYHNFTVGARLTHEFPEFRTAPRDEVVDLILRKDALKYGYEAVSFTVNGGAALYDGESPADGFLWFTEWDWGFDGVIFSDNWDTIARYFRIFSDSRFTLSFYSSEKKENVQAQLYAHGIQADRIEANPQLVCRSAPPVPAPPEGIFLRELTSADEELIRKFYTNAPSKHPAERKRFSENLLYELSQRDMYGNGSHSVFVFGIFRGEEMIGWSLGALQKTHGFTLNNGIATEFFDGVDRADVRRYAFVYVTNAALERGAVSYAEPPEGENASAYGYETAGYCCTIK